MVGAAGDMDRREAEDLKQSDKGLGQQPPFYCNSSLSKQFIDLDLPNEHHISYYSKEENVLKLRLDYEMKGELFKIVNSQLRETEQKNQHFLTVTFRTCPHEVKMVMLSHNKCGKVIYHLQFLRTDGHRSYSKHDVEVK